MSGTLDALEASFEEAERVDRFWDDHHAEYLQKYPEQFVAILRSSFEVVAVSDDLATLIAELDQRRLDLPADVAIEFVRDASKPLLL